MLEKLLAFSETALAKTILDYIYGGLGILAGALIVTLVWIEIRAWNKKHHSDLF